ncbi:hypothetical protein Tco_1465989 [Tanacetum coccineum]
MDDPNITMEEYIRLEEEKAHRRGKVFNCETAKYGKIWYDEDVHGLRSVKTEFSAIVFDDAFTPEVTHSCEPTISSLNNNEIDFRISFNESDDEDYTVIFDKNSFSYKIISANDLKTDSENDNNKVNMPSFPSPEPTVSCIEDLDFFKDFENEFPAIFYNDALTSKSYFSTEPTLCPQHIDKFDLKMKHHCPNMIKRNKTFCTLMIGTGYSLKEKNKAKPNKTEHEFEKSMKNRGQRYKRIENGAKMDISGSTRQRLCI